MTTADVPAVPTARPVSLRPEHQATAAAGRPHITVLAGPTAVGKGTVSRYIRENYPQVWLSVSATTRPPRPGEENGVHYWFVSDEEFDAMVEKGDLLEWAVVHKAARYGTPRGPVDLALASGQPAMRNVTSVAMLPRGVRSSTPSIPARRSAAARARRAARSCDQGRPTYIESQPQLRARPMSDGRWKNPNSNRRACGQRTAACGSGFSNEM